MTHETPEIPKTIEAVDYRALVSMEQAMFASINQMLWEKGAGESRVAKVARRAESARLITLLAEHAVKEDLAGHLHA